MAALGVGHDIAMGGRKVTGHATPTATDDAATKGYVDNRYAAGTGTTGGSGLAVTFPAGRFGSAPVVVATLAGYSANVQLLVTSLTSTGCTVLAYNITNGNNVSGVSVRWIAVAA
jgi:hypothetical protein